jgi:hypothetical protein
MTTMRAPERGHGQSSTRGVSGATSGCFWGSAAGGATLRSARAVAMLSARLVEAKSPWCRMRWKPLGSTCIRKRLTGEIPQHLLRPCEWRLAVDHPLDAPQRGPRGRLETWYGLCEFHALENCRCTLTTVLHVHLECRRLTPLSTREGTALR